MISQKTFLMKKIKEKKGDISHYYKDGVRCKPHGLLLWLGVVSNVGELHVARVHVIPKRWLTYTQ